MGKDQEFLEAARNGNITIIEKVLNQKSKRAGPLASLRRGPGVNVQDSSGYSALHHACLNGHEEIVHLLLAHEASPNLPDSRGSSSLHLAAWAGHQEIVKLLLTHPFRPANPNSQTIENETPLHCAAQHGHTGALALLLAHDADPNMRNTRGETPLDLAAQYGRLQAVQMLIRAHPELLTPYSNAAIEGRHAQAPSQHKSRHASPLPHSGSVSTPSPSSPSVNSSPATPTRHIFPHTCLHLASRNGHKQVVDVLLTAGVSVNLLTSSGSALHEAALCGKESVVRTLLRAGIDLNATDAEQRTALDILKEFPPHVTKHIIAVINNFRNQMDTDDGDEVIYRHHPPVPPQRNSSSNSNTSSYNAKQQQHNNHYHFNSNNHLLNHSHSMQQSGYSKRFAATTFNGSSGGAIIAGGKSLDSGLQPEEGSGGSELGVSPSSSMSSFEPASVSPRSRSSTGGIVGGGAGHTVHLSSFAPLSAPPKKPPRRNLSVSPTHTGQQFSYASPNHQQQPIYAVVGGGRGQPRSASNDSPYSHQSHGSVGGMSFDETQLRERQRGDRLFASARESTRSATGISMSSSSNDMLDQYSDATGVKQDGSSNSMKRPMPPPRNISKDIINCENPTLKSYNPNRKLKRNRNSYSLGVGEKEPCSQSSDSNSNSDQSKQPMSPTNYQQPPTPEHPPPSSSQAERTIYERIRPLSQEYKRRSALLHLQQAQQHIKIDSSTSPPKNAPTVIAPPYDFAYEPALPAVPLYQGGAALQGSSGSLSSSVSYSDQSISTDCVEEFIGDAPFAGLLKGSTVHQQQQQANGRAFAPRSSSAPEHKPPQASKQRSRPPIPTKPVLPPERKLFKGTQSQQLPTTPSPQPQTIALTASNGCVDSEQPKAAESEQSTPPETGDSSTEDSSNGLCSQQQRLNDGEECIDGEGDASSILSPFNAEEARKKISEIIESFGSGILNTNITPTNDIELDFDDLDVPAERHELAVRLRGAGLLHLERMLFENGYDNYKFVNGVLDEDDAQLMHIPEHDASKLLRFVRSLPLAEFLPQMPTNKLQQENNKPGEGTTGKSANSEAAVKGVATLSQWLSSINLPEYIESFNKHLYNSIDSVCGVWDVELQTVLEINKLGHRRRILQSVRYMREPKASVRTPLAENNETNRINGAAHRAELPQQRNSISGYRKNRPAPPPPSVKQRETPIPSAQQSQHELTLGVEKDKELTLQIRAPSELLLGLPANLRTKWRHSANVLLNEQIRYEVQYLGSTVVKELRGTESTRKSIKKLRRDQQRTETNAMSSTANATTMQKLSRNSSLNRKRATVCLAISHLGVEFIDVYSKHTICEHEIQNINCACQDAEDLRHFAYITKEQDVHYCHVFSVEGTDMATEIILTLGQAFEVAYQLALRDGITATPLVLNNSILQGELTAGEPN